MAPGTVTFLVMGNYTPGTYPVVRAAPVRRQTRIFTISFTQTPANTGAISASGTFAYPQFPNPNPCP